jgi:hypothetical protein
VSHGTSALLSGNVTQEVTRRLVFGRCSVQISARTPTSQTDAIRGCPQSFPEISKVVSRINNKPFLPNQFQFIIKLLSYNSMPYSLYTGSVAK